MEVTKDVQKAKFEIDFNPLTESNLFIQSLNVYLAWS